MLAAIAEARETIRLEMYIYAASPIGETFREALTEACGRGVRVRVMIDALGSLVLPQAFWEPLASAGGEFRWFNPITLNRCGFRNHRKLLVCDDTTAFVGGFNIATEYEGDGVTRGWHDLGLKVTGRLAKELSGSFDTLFAMADFAPKRFARLRRALLQRVIPTRDGQILLSAPGLGRNVLRKALLRDLDEPRRVRIISAYFIPTRQLRMALSRLARKGTLVQLILAGKTDVALSQLASRRFYAGFLRAGVEIYEYQPQILHAKLFVIDDNVYAGSANLDRRSFYINYEVTLRLANPALARDADAFFEKALAHSKRVDKNEWNASRTLWESWKERLAFFILARLDPLVARRQMRYLK